AQIAARRDHLATRLLGALAGPLGFLDRFLAQLAFGLGALFGFFARRRQFLDLGIPPQQLQALCLFALARFLERRFGLLEIGFAELDFLAQPQQRVLGFLVLLRSRLGFFLPRQLLARRRELVHQARRLVLGLGQLRLRRILRAFFVLELAPQLGQL